MKLTEALQITGGKRSPEAAAYRAFLACGFTPLHLATFFAAHLQRAMPDRRVEVATGLFGALDDTLAGLGGSHGHSAAIVLEWPDLDPRLGMRQLGGWGPALLPDILADLQSHLDRIGGLIQAASETLAVGVALPSLPLPPLFFTPGWQAAGIELGLREAVLRFAARIASLPNVRVLNAQRLDMVSPPAGRFDCQSELIAGFPYTIRHADSMGEMLAQLVRPRTPKKGLVTDLDNTLWKGIVGEDGPAGVSWDLPAHAQLHGIYQQLLSSLADSGVLLAVASKNDPAPVDAAFARPDIILPKARCYPLEVHWNRKSESVARILDVWNIGPESVVFIDDSPAELAEVKEAYPEIECLAFPAGNYAAVPEFFRSLRDLFGKDRISSEDVVRMESIRAAGALRAETQSGDLDGFLERAQPSLAVTFTKFPADPRVLELVNKTNQFNLNGIRYTESEWSEFMNRQNSFLLSSTYRDKYGPLGKIAVLAGTKSGTRVCVDVWVMSCRAFGRRIEHKCLDLLFETFGASEIAFRFAPTPKNGPIQTFLGSIANGDAGFRLSRETFSEKCPALFHRTECISE